MKKTQLVRSLALVSILALAGCSNSGVSISPSSSDSGGVDGSSDSKALSVYDVAEACQKAVEKDLNKNNIPHDKLFVHATDVSETHLSDDDFDGPLKGSLYNDDYSGAFHFDCETDGSTTKVDNFDFPQENFRVDSSRNRSQQTEVDPNRLDPDNDGAGRAGRDDNLGITYHNKVDWQFLEAPGKVVPGGMILNRTNGSSCSTGFIASRDNRVFIVTAGHCGNKGDKFDIRDSRGNTLRVGEMVESYVERHGQGIVGADIGLIELYPNVRQYVDSALPMNAKLKRWITPQEAERRNMEICRLGATTGYSCGVFVSVDKAGQFYFRNIMDRGDSGGAIFAVDRSGVWALGVVSRVSDYNKTLGGGMEIASAMRHWGLTLHG